MMTRLETVLQRGHDTHHLYTWYKQKIGLGAEEDESEVGKGTQSLSSPYPKNLNQATPGVSCSICFYETLRYSHWRRHRRGSGK